MKNSISNTPPAAERTLQILDCFMADPSPKTLRDLSNTLQIPFTSVYRIVQCMKDYGYLTEDHELDSHFRLGYKLSRFSEIAFTEQHLIRIAKPIMDKVCARLGQACQLCMLTDTGVCTIEQSLPLSAITYITELNETIPVNISASGKILTALLPAKKRQRFLKKTTASFFQKTPFTIVDPVRFEEVLSETLSLGYGTDDQEYAMGIGCISYPIFLADDEPIAAIGTTGPYHFYQDAEELERIHATLQNASAEIAASMNK